MKKISAFILLVLAFMTLPFFNIVVAASPVPTVAIYPPSSGVVEVGGSVTYRIVATNATSFSVSSSDVGIARGVSASVSIQDVSSTEKLVVLSNIQGNVGTSGYIAIKAGVGKNGSNSSKTTPASTAFTIVASSNNNNNDNNNSNTNNGTVTPSPSTPSNTNTNTNTNTNVDNNTENNNQTEEEPTDNTEENNGEETKDTEAPKLSFVELSSNSVKAGEELSFEVNYTDDVGIETITLSESDITLYGFTATVKVSGDGDTRKITLSNIQGDLGGLKYIVIKKGTVIDKAGNKDEVDSKSSYFKLVDDTTTSKASDWIQNPNTGR